MLRLTTALPGYPVWGKALRWNDCPDAGPCCLSQDPRQQETLLPKEPMNKPTFSGPNEALLRKMGGDTKHLLDPARGVYTNRDLNLQTISHIGFDMDYTLAIYKKLPMEQLQYDLTVERLINTHHYPESIRELQYDPSFIICGLLVDKHTGHLIKINSHNQVWRASFGRRQVLIEDIQAHYQNEKIRLDFFIL